MLQHAELWWDIHTAANCITHKNVIRWFNFSFGGSSHLLSWRPQSVSGSKPLYRTGLLRGRAGPHMCYPAAFPFVVFMNATSSCFSLTVCISAGKASSSSLPDSELASHGPAEQNIFTLGLLREISSVAIKSLWKTNEAVRNEMPSLKELTKRGISSFCTTQDVNFSFYCPFVTCETSYDHSVSSCLYCLVSIRSQSIRCRAAMFSGRLAELHSNAPLSFITSSVTRPLHGLHRVHLDNCVRIYEKRACLSYL